MNVKLLYKDKDFIEDYFYNIDELSLLQRIDKFSLDLLKDLELEIIINKMSNNDKIIYQVCKYFLCNPESDINTILFRQEILKDVIKNKEVIRNIYSMTFSIKEEKIKRWLGIFGIKTPSNIVYNSRELLETQINYIKKLKEIAIKNINNFDSYGFKRFFNMLIEDFSDDYLAKLENYLEKLKLENALYASVKLNQNLEGEEYELIYPESNKNLNFFRYKFSYSFKINPKDESGAKIVEHLRNIILKDISKYIYLSSLNIELFFNQLQIELAFYIGALNLIESIEENNYYYTFPEPLNMKSEYFYFENLFDLSLSFIEKKKIIPNSIEKENKNIFIITGANKGGKTTFLRSIGIAQILMQAGLIVPAKNFKSPIFNKIFTHFKKEEDKNLKHGKFEEEINRINEIISNIKPYSLILLNESFSSTNEFEGSEIGLNIIKALSLNNITTFFVTHLYSLPIMLLENPKYCFLMAEISSNNKRTYKIIEGAPSKTSYALDLFYKIFNL